MKFHAICLSLALCLSAYSAHAERVADIGDLGWLAGVWIGDGRDGDDGKTQGVARLYWTPPLEGSVSLFFTWHAADSQHVHYAVNIFRQTQSGILGKGIHYGPDFGNFEDHPWSLEATKVTGNRAVFRCVEHCRARSVSFSLLDDGTLEERWKPDPGTNKPDWIVRYRRAD